VTDQLTDVAATLAAMTAEVREINVEKGWRRAEGGPGDNSFGDYLALLHSELSEALESYRDHRLADATAVEDCEGPVCDIHGHEPIKPEGVGSEFADILIRLPDMADVFGIDLAFEYQRKVAYNRARPYQHGGRTVADGGTA
jgi:NTP pyrophosphatase (non-canonical NTP hydrolase)